MTSAFPAEYGNAIGGVFDLGFRNGNINDYEYTVQMGVFTGLEVMAEGPMGKKDGSFLVAGRYSLAGLFGDKTKNEYKRELVNARRDTVRFLVLQKEVSYADLQLVKKFPILRRGKNKGGFIVTQKSKRELPFRLLAARTIGYFNENSNKIGRASCRERV